MELIIKNDLDTLIREYQLNNIKLTREMLLTAFGYRHFTIVDFLFKSGLGCLPSEVHYNTLPNEIKELIDEYENKLENNELSLEDLQEIQKDTDNTNIRTMLIHKIIKDMCQVKPVEKCEIEIDTIESIINGEINFVEGYGYVYKITGVIIGYDLGFSMVHQLPVRLDNIDEFLNSYDIIYDYTTPSKTVPFSPSRKWICIRHFLPPVIRSNINAYSFNNVHTPDKNHIINNYKHNLKKNDIIFDDKAQTTPEHRDKYLCIYIEFTNLKTEISTYI